MGSNPSLQVSSPAHASSPATAVHRAGAWVHSRFIHSFMHTCMHKKLERLLRVGEVMRGAGGAPTNRLMDCRRGLRVCFMPAPALPAAALQGPGLVLTAESARQRARGAPDTRAELRAPAGARAPGAPRAAAGRRLPAASSPRCAGLRRHLVHGAGRDTRAPARPATFLPQRPRSVLSPFL